MPVNQSVTTYESHRDILAVSKGAEVIATYTLDSTYITPVTLPGSDSEPVLHEGTILALNPANGLVVPNYTSYGFGVVGVLYQAADTRYGNVEVPVVFDNAEIVEADCADNGTFGTVLAATKTALSGRINFTVQDRL